MIKRIPGWLNFILLFIFYSFVFYGFMHFVLLMIYLYGRLLHRFGNVSLLVAIIFLIMIPLFFAGGYLAKWREKQGGGWRFW